MRIKKPGVKFSVYTVFAKNFAVKGIIVINTTGCKAYNMKGSLGISWKSRFL
jgi:hypothetical protein